MENERQQPHNDLDKQSISARISVVILSQRSLELYCIRIYAINDEKETKRQ